MHPRLRLAQYFTPPAVVDLAYDLLRWLEPGVIEGCLLDPSCGEGAFLEGALRAGFAPARLYGCDADPALRAVWSASGLRGGNGPHLAICDGLAGRGDGSFDVVAGNPPFAGSQALPADVARLGRYRWGEIARQKQSPPRLPRELWFLERSLHLLRDGGLLALVLPHGVLANKRWEPVRAALLAEAQIEAVIGLPRDTFRASGITVKTCLLIARKVQPRAEHRVRLAELGPLELAAASAALAAAWEGGHTLAEGEPWAVGR